MNYGIPVVPATGGGIFLTALGIQKSNYVVLTFGLILLGMALFSHIKLRRNEK